MKFLLFAKKLVVPKKQLLVFYRAINAMLEKPIKPEKFIPLIVVFVSRPFHACFCFLFAFRC